MVFKIMKSLLLRRSMAKRVLLRAFLVAFAIAIFPSLQLIRDVDDESTKLNSYYDACATSSNQALTAFPGRFVSLVYVFPYLANVIPCKEMGNITMDMFKELMDEKLLKINAKALCVGDGTASAVPALRELGFINIAGMNRHPFFSLMRKSFVYELEFEDESFDYVFSSDINRVTVPALLVYHPDLAGNKVAVNGDPPDPPPENEEFDFLAWFRETVAAGDFVVMKMNAQGVELQLLHKLFESGDICLVDELFLRCTDNVDGQGSKDADCLNLVKGLRSNGVFVHQWLEN